MGTTVGVFSTHETAAHAINELHAMGVASEDLSYLYVDTKGNITDGTSGEKVGASAATGVATGALVGAMAGLVVVTGILPGLGALFVAGPLAAALGLTGAAATTAAGAVTGAAAGGILGALAGLGVSDADAGIYESLVRAGDVLVIVRTASIMTKEVFEKTGAKEIREYVTA